MGNSATNPFSTETWNFDHREDYYDIYRSSRGQFAEKHIVPNHPKIQMEDEMEIYNFRNKTAKPIVHVYDADFEKPDNTCGKEKNINVYSEYIPHRLSDTVNLTHGQGLYVLSEALYGFEELHHRFGGFSIYDDLIGFNDQGETRVWHSPNFGSNHLPSDGIMLMSTRNPRKFDQRIEQKQEEEMVEDIWLAVGDHANMRPDFIERTRHFRDMNFDEARRFVASEITQKNFHQDYVPDHLNFRDARRFRNDDAYGRSSHERNMSQGEGRDSRYGTYRDSRVSPPYDGRFSNETGNRQFRNSRYRTEQDNQYRRSQASNQYYEGERAPAHYRSNVGPIDRHVSNFQQSRASDRYNNEISHQAAYQTANDY